MSLNKMKRRAFLKIMGWSGVGATLAGCDMPTTVTLKEGDETVVSYLDPEEYVIPGVGVWYASTCQQCPAGCGVHGRVREGRVLKLEGNPDSSINAGRLCQMGQAGLQAHYNPDRITAPRLQSGGKSTQISWEEAFDLLERKTGAGSGLKGERFGWVTGTLSGHQAVLLDAHLKASGSSNHYAHEVIHDGVWRAVCRDMLGDEQPVIEYSKAKVILSFGADFLGTWGSPVHNATEYARFRSSPRGVLIQAEPNMTLTGANADLWMPVRPGTEGVLALGIANVLATRSRIDIGFLPAALQQQIRAYNLNEVARITGASGDHIMRTAQLLSSRRPSLVLAGASAEGQENGYDTVAAIMTLNLILGNIGKTITPGQRFPFAQMTAKSGSSKGLLNLAEALDRQQLDVLFFHGANPVYTAPAALKLQEKLQAVPFKVAFSMFEDETTMAADLVLPLRSPLEDWGTHVPAGQGETTVISIQQPLMEPLHAEPRGFGDLLLTLLKARGASEYQDFPDYYSYLQSAFASLPAAFKPAVGSDAEFWNNTLQKGVLKVSAGRRSLSTRSVAVTVKSPTEDAQYPYRLVPTARLGLWDGRHANIPWLQEAADQISKTVWDSWAEIHPKTAAKLGVKNGDAIRIASEQGSIEAKVYVYKGVHPDVIAVPMGQGHEHYGRYAAGRGVNPLKILNPTKDAKTGELALAGTRVQASRTKAKDILVRMGGSETQLGRKIVATVSADIFERTEGEA